MLSLVDGIGRYGQNSADVLARLRFFRPARSETAVPAHRSRNQMFVHATVPSTAIITRTVFVAASNRTMVTRAGVTHKRDVEKCSRC